MVQTVKNLPAIAGDLGSIPGSERSPGEGNGNPLQYSCLENPMDRGAWCVTVHGVTKESDTTERLSSLWLVYTFPITHFSFAKQKNFISLCLKRLL